MVPSTGKACTNFDAACLSDVVKLARSEKVPPHLARTCVAGKSSTLEQWERDGYSYGYFFSFPFIFYTSWFKAILAQICKKVDTLFNCPLDQSLGDIEAGISGVCHPEERRCRFYENIHTYEKFTHTHTPTHTHTHPHTHVRFTHT